MPHFELQNWGFGVRVPFLRPETSKLRISHQLEKKERKRKRERKKGKVEKFEGISKRQGSVLGVRRHRASFKDKILILFPLISKSFK